MPVNHKNLQALICFDLAFSRVDWIRTSDPLHPIQVRYRAAPPPEVPQNQVLRFLRVQI